MRTTLLLLIIAVASAFAHHHCIYSSLESTFEADMRRNPKPLLRRKGFHAQAVAPIRIVISTADLDDPARYCTAAGQTRPNFAGQNTVCTAADVFNSTKKSILVNNIIPAAIATIQRSFSLESVAQPIAVPQQACGSHTIPTTHASGVANADYVLYVSAGQTTDGTLAWAGGCMQDSAGRTIVGRANFGPAYIDWGSAKINREQVSTAVHEIFHAMGFSGSSFTKTTSSLRGKSVSLVTSTRVTAKYREYFNCPSLSGAELEDEGSAGSAGSHWDRRTLPEEIMAPSGGETLSVMTLAAFEDLGHYTVNYTNAETMTFGKGSGCGFVTEKCNTVSGGRDKWWCFDTNQNNNYCTPDFTHVGYCSVQQYTAALPSAFQYFSDPTLGGYEFFDGCPRITGFSNRDCTEARVASNSEAIFGHWFGTGGRCFVTSGVIQNGYESTNVGTTRCLRSRCTSAGVVEFTMSGSTTWKSCTTPGGTIGNLPGYAGTVTCPTDAANFCAGLTASGSSGIVTETSPTPPPPPGLGTPTAPTPRPPVQTPAPPPPAGQSSTPAPTTAASATVTGTVIITGNNFGTLLQNAELTVRLENAFRTDVANLLGTVVANVLVTRMSLGSLVVAYGVVDRVKSEVDTAFSGAISNGGAAWMPEVRALYTTTGASDSPTLTSAETAAESSQCGEIDTETCAIILVGVGVVLIILLILCCYCCCCRKKEEAATGGAHLYHQQAHEPYGATGGHGRRR